MAAQYRDIATWTPGKTPDQGVVFNVIENNQVARRVTFGPSLTFCPRGRSQHRCSACGQAGIQHCYACTLCP